MRAACHLYRYVRLLGVHESGSRGALFLYDLIRVPPPAIAAAVTVMGILAFIGAEKVESMLGGARTARGARRFAFATMAILSAATLVTMAIPSGAAAASAAGVRTVSAAELARIVIDQPCSVRIVDVREPAAFAKSRIPASQNIDAASLVDLPDDSPAIVVIGDASRLPPNGRTFSRTCAKASERNGPVACPKIPSALGYPGWRIFLGDLSAFLLIVPFFGLPFLVVGGRFRS